MIATWMLYAIALSAAVSVSAALIERALRLRGRSARHVWALALLASIGLPLFAYALPDTVGGAAATVSGAVEVTAWPRQVVGTVRSAVAAIDGAARVGWIVASLFVGVTIALSRVSIARERRMWSRAEVDGTPIWVSRGIGPAVIGFVRSMIVLPRWAMEAPPRLRTLMLVHEREHLAAGDPLLLLFGLSALVLAPWNPLMWWQLRRLRVAVEIDCDARVLARCGAARDYAELLIEVARRGRAGRLAVAAFSSPATAIERRIRMMVSQPPRGAGVLALACAGLAVGVLVVACEMPAPSEPEALQAPEAAAPRVKSDDGRIAEIQVIGTRTVEGMPRRTELERKVCGDCDVADAASGIRQVRLREIAEVAAKQALVEGRLIPLTLRPVESPVREFEAVAGRLEEVVVSGRQWRTVLDEAELVNKVRIRERAPGGPGADAEVKTPLLRRTGG